MSRFPLPSDDRLEQLIRDSYEFTPGPDMRRLNQLEERLSRSTTATRSRRKLHTLPWWIVLLLVGGFAAAAWWAGEQWLERSGLLPVTTQMQSPVDDTMTSIEPDAVDRDPPEGQTTTQDRDSSVIYQRENF